MQKETYMNHSPIREVELTSMAYGGTALGHLSDGRMVFVPYAIEGERVRIAITEEKHHYAKADLIEVIRPAASRITPRCQHFGVCGGCHYQHIDYEQQLTIKAAILRDQLRRIGGFEHLPEVEIYPSPNPWNYRNTFQFHVNHEGQLGFQKAGTTDTVLINECYLGQAPLQDLWKQIELEPNLGIERLTFRCAANDEVMLVIENKSDEIPNLSVEGLPISVVHLSHQEGVVLVGSDHLWMEVHGRLFHLSAGAFFQVNNLVAEKMVDDLLNHLELKPSSTVFDVYCGGGLYSAFLAGKVNRLIGIESAIAACHDFEVNLAEFDNVELYEDTAENVLPYLNIKADVILLDPPRDGLTKPVRKAIAAHPPAQLVYISCDPSTLSRDGRYLANAGFRLERLAFFDMFPQTYHIESMSYWRYQ